MATDGSCKVLSEEVAGGSCELLSAEEVAGGSCELLSEEVAGCCCDVSVGDAADEDSWGPDDVDAEGPRHIIKNCRKLLLKMSCNLFYISFLSFTMCGESMTGPYQNVWMSTKHLLVSLMYTWTQAEQGSLEKLKHICQSDWQRKKLLPPTYYFCVMCDHLSNMYV